MAGRLGIAAVAAALLLGGCAYDYVQRSDRVAYHAGDAVKANLERETLRPTSKSRYSTDGIGKNGAILQPDTTPSLGQ